MIVTLKKNKLIILGLLALAVVLTVPTINAIDSNYLALNPDAIIQLVKKWGRAIGIVIIIGIGVVLIVKRNVITFITSILLAIGAFVLIVAPDFIADSAENLGKQTSGGIQFN